MNSADASDSARPFDWKGCCLYPALALVAVFVAVVVWSFATHEESSPEPSAEMASYHCREMVKEQLKDPASAEFTGEEVTGYGTYTVTGTVHATNSLGGTAAHDYSCTATFDESDGGYFVEVQVR